MRERGDRSRGGRADDREDLSDPLRSGLATSGDCDPAAGESSFARARFASGAGFFVLFGLCSAFECSAAARRCARFFAVRSALRALRFARCSGVRFDFFPCRALSSGCAFSGSAADSTSPGRCGAAALGVEGFGAATAGFGDSPPTPSTVVARGFGAGPATGFGDPIAAGFGAGVATGFGAGVATGFGAGVATGFGAGVATGFGAAALDGGGATGFGAGATTGFGVGLAAGLIAGASGCDPKTTDLAAVFGADCDAGVAGGFGAGGVTTGFATTAGETTGAAPSVAASSGLGAGFGAGAAGSGFDGGFGAGAGTAGFAAKGLGAGFGAGGGAGARGGSDGRSSQPESRLSTSEGGFSLMIYGGSSLP
jgi:hypothetical protein